MPCQLSSLVLVEIIAGELLHSFWKWVFQSPISEDINGYFGDLESQVTLHTSPIFPPLSSFVTEHLFVPWWAGTDWKLSRDIHNFLSVTLPPKDTLLTTQNESGTRTLNKRILCFSFDSISHLSIPQYPQGWVSLWIMRTLSSSPWTLGCKLLQPWTGNVLQVVGYWLSFQSHPSSAATWELF